MHYEVVHNHNTNEVSGVYPLIRQMRPSPSAKQAHPPQDETAHLSQMEKVAIAAEEERVEAEAAEAAISLMASDIEERLNEVEEAATKSNASCSRGKPSLGKLREALEDPALESEEEEGAQANQKQEWSFIDVEKLVSGRVTEVRESHTITSYNNEGKIIKQEVKTRVYVLRGVSGKEE